MRQPSRWVWTRVEKNCWPFVLDILDDCKCSENFLAPTITSTPILLSATFSIQIVDGLRRRAGGPAAESELTVTSTLQVPGWPASRGGPRQRPRPQ